LGDVRLKIVTVTEEGQTVVCESQDSESLSLYDFSGKKRADLKGKRNPALVTRVGLSRDGKLMAAALEGKALKIWEVATGKELAVLAGQGDILCVAFSHDGKLLAAGDDKKNLIIWELAAIIDGK